MQWTKPEFEEISLGMEVTGYVNTGQDWPTAKEPQKTENAPPAPRETAG
jgi:coenzyme PQQ precursor peptide PqqA